MNDLHNIEEVCTNLNKKNGLAGFNKIIKDICSQETRSLCLILN